MIEEDKGTAAEDTSSGAEAQTAHRGSWADEAALIQALRSGDENAFARLVDQHHASLCRVARLYVSSQAVADEVVQDTWLAVIQGLWAFEGRSSLRTWIFRILINRAKTRAVRESRTVPFAEMAEDDSGIEARSRTRAERRDPAPSPESGLLTQEAALQLRAAIEALPANQRIVITMRDLEGCSSEEVCNVLGLSETNQRVVLHRARYRVRSRLAAYFRKD
jgi:RNA polymerase sigma-70 factor (ECF subfamily)